MNASVPTPRQPRPAAETTKRDITIAELVLKFMEHANTYYVDPITKIATNEVIACRAALRPLCRMYADIPASEFGGAVVFQ